MPSVVADPAPLGLPDEQVPAYTTAQGRAMVTANIKDFVPTAATAPLANPARD